jgi:uncharacterized membrane protein
LNSTRNNSSDAVPASISQNIEVIGDYNKREDERMGRAQRLLERLSAAMGRPLFLVALLAFVALWVTANLLALRIGFAPFDRPPFAKLQGLVSLAALLTTTIVLIAQNRLAKLEQRRQQLELQVNILTEQKTTKLIHLIEELRRDLPMVRDRHDPDAATLQQPTDTTQILTVLEAHHQSAEAAKK